MTGASGAGASAPEAGADTGALTSDASGTSGPFPSGPSAGCGMPPPASAGTTNMKIQTITVPSCGTGPVTPTCVAPAFSPGGADYLKVQQWDFNNRNYGIQLPANYDPMTPYPVILGGGGCTAGPTTLGGGFSAGEGTSAIRIGLSYVGQCFADGGVGSNNGFGCAVDEAHIADCITTPEVPYVNAVLDYVESSLCVDLGKIFIGGLSSGAWEASTVSCALANRIRGMTTVAGGLRIHRPACDGTTAAFMIVDGGDNSNPIGPMVAGQALPAAGLSAAQVSSDITFLDSYGAAPMRDELLSRNGCQGTATAVYPGYPCPAAYPVVWCFMPGEGHGGSFYENVNYGPGAWTFFSQLPTP
jgi:poly(3-hydroxybutyrate) depolymerase